MILRPYSRYVYNVPDREKQPFLRDFLVAPDTPLAMKTDPPPRGISNVIVFHLGPRMWWECLI